LEEAYPPPKVKHTYPELGGLNILYICHGKDAIRIFLILLAENPDFDAVRVKIAMAFKEGE